MKLLGSIELSSNNRVTLPAKAVESVGFDQGMILLVYEDKGRLILKKPSGDE